MEGGGAHHRVKSKREEHQEEDDGPERRKGQPGQGFRVNHKCNSWPWKEQEQ